MISIYPASSNKKGDDTRSLPAFGYEFIEKEKAVSCLPYYGGSVLGMNKNIIWLRNNLYAKLKLVLAAAMTAMLQIKA